jgi:NlpC/P60 family putative phage cell wall peptidase
MAQDIRRRVVASARDHLGTPYLHQASLKGVGCDCLGLLRSVWREVIGHEPEAPPAYAADWAESTSGEPMVAAARRHLAEIAVADARTGDVVLFRWRANLPAKHCAILTGRNTMIHAHDGACVAEVALTPWWRRHIAHAFRFPGVV